MLGTVPDVYKEVAKEVEEKVEEVRTMLGKPDTCEKADARVSKEVEEVKTTLTKYERKIKGKIIDIYDIIKAYNITNPAAAHAVKKLLRNGDGTKSKKQDFNEAIDSIKRAIELEL